jgi:hypothetical protein
MWPVMAYLSIGAFRADAVFVSGLQRCDAPSAGQVPQAAAAIRAFGYSGCAGRVAQEFGDHSCLESRLLGDLPVPHGGNARVSR